MSAKAAVRHVAGVLGEVGLPAPPPEVFRLAKHGDPIAYVQSMCQSERNQIQMLWACVAICQHATVTEQWFCATFDKMCSSHGGK